MTATTTNIKTRRGPPLTAWELPRLLVPVNQHRKKQKPSAAAERPHYAAILGYIYRNRYALANQMQRRFASILRSDRTARRHLAEMESLGYLGLVPTRAVGPLWPKIYFVTKRGARRLRQALAEKGKAGSVIRVDRQRREGYSADHVLHEILITEFLLSVWETIESKPHLELLRTERRSLPSNLAFIVGVGGHRTRLEPDAMFVHRARGRGLIASFVEIDTGTMSIAQIEAKYRRYEAWSQSSAGQHYLMDLYRRYGAQNPRPAFRILLLVTDKTFQHDEGRMLDLVETAAKFPTVRRSAWFTTLGDLRTHQAASAPLSAVPWERGDQGQSQMFT